MSVVSSRAGRAAACVSPLTTHNNNLSSCPLLCVCVCAQAKAMLYRAQIGTEEKVAEERKAVERERKKVKHVYRYAPPNMEFGMSKNKY